MSNAVERLARIMRGMAEPFLAMVSAIALTVLLTAPFVPTRTQLEVKLRPAVDAEPASHQRLEELAREAELAEEVQVRLFEEASRLVLTGVEAGGEVEENLAGLLRSSGYQEYEPESVEVLHWEALLSPGQRGLPLAMTINAVVFLALGLFLARRRIGLGMLEPAMSRGRAVLYGVGTGLVTVVLSWAVALLLKLAHMPVEEQAWLTELYADPGTLLRISPWVVLAAPLAEEIFFRLYVFRFIAAHAGFPAGLVVSSLMFSIVHFNPSGLLIYLGIGCLLGWVYHRTGRIVAPIVAHAVLNAIVLIATAMAIEPGI